MSDTPIKIKVYVVTVHLVDCKEPCLPRVFGTLGEAEAHLEECIRADWDELSIEDDAGNPLPYPGNWRTAHDFLCDWMTGDYGEWALNVVEVDIPAVAALVRAARIARIVIENRTNAIEIMEGKEKSLAAFPSYYSALDALRDSVALVEPKA